MSQLDLHTLIRLAADGELSQEETQLLEARAVEVGATFDVQQAIAFERSLREAVARCMREQDGTCPIDLPARVRSALADQLVGSADTDTGHVLAWPGRWIPSGLAAGIVVLIAVALAIGLWGRGWEIIGGPDADRVAWKPPYSWSVTTADAALNELRDMTGILTAELPDLSGFDYRFAGANRLMLDDGRSVLQAGYSGNGPFIIIWLESATDLSSDFYNLSMTVGQGYRVTRSDGDALSEPSDPMVGHLAWVADGLIFYVSARDASGSAPGAARTVAQSLGMPDGVLTSISRQASAGSDK